MSTGDVLTIGRFAALSRLSVRTLRRYDEAALLRPAHRDATSGRRAYRLSQIADAERIRLLRSAGLGLDQIGAILAGVDDEQLRAILHERRRVLDDEIEHLSGQAAVLARLLDGDPPLPRYDIRLVERTSFFGIALGVTTDRERLARGVGDGARRLLDHLRDRQQSAAGPLESWWTADDHEADRFSMRLVLPTQSPVPGDGADIRTVEARGGPAATTLHVGSYDLVPRAFEAVAAWIDGQVDLEPVDGPREIYLVGPTRAGDEALRTEISWPLRRRAAA